MVVYMFLENQQLILNGIAKTIPTIKIFIKKPKNKTTKLLSSNYASFPISAA